MKALKIGLTFLIFMGLKMNEGYKYFIVKPCKYLFVDNLRETVMYVILVIIGMLVLSFNMWLVYYFQPTAHWTAIGIFGIFGVSAVEGLLVLLGALFWDGYGEDIKQGCMMASEFIKGNWNKAEEIQERWTK